MTKEEEANRSRRGSFFANRPTGYYSALPPWRLHSDLKCLRSLPCSPLAFA
jgi:hypothetical protein